MTATEKAAQPRIHRPMNAGAPDEAHLECRVCRLPWPCPAEQQTRTLEGKR